MLAWGWDFSQNGTGLCRRLQNHRQPAGGRGDVGPSLDSVGAWPCPLSKVPQILLCCRRRRGRGWLWRPGDPSARAGATPESSAAFPEPAQLAPFPRPRSRLAPSSVLCGSARAPGSFSLHLLTPRGNPCQGSTGPHPPDSAPEPPGRGTKGGGARDARAWVLKATGQHLPPAAVGREPDARAVPHWRAWSSPGFYLQDASFTSPLPQ